MKCDTSLESLTLLQYKLYRFRGYVILPPVANLDSYFVGSHAFNEGSRPITSEKVSSKSTPVTHEKV